MRVPLTVTAGCALLAGCVVSIETAIPDQSLLAVPALAGTWESQDHDVVVITREDVLYTLRYTDSGGRTGTFEGRVGRVGGQLALEVTPRPDSLEVREPYRSTLLPGRYLFLVRFAAEDLVSVALDPDSARRALTSGEVPGPALVDAKGYHGVLVLTGDSMAVRATYDRLLARPANLSAEAHRWRRVAGP